MCIRDRITIPADGHRGFANQPSGPSRRVRRARERQRVTGVMMSHLTFPESQFGARRPHGDEDDDLAAERESDARRVWRSRGHGARWRGGDEAGDEAEESPSHEGAVRARGEVSLELHGVRRLSPREEALSVQGVRRGINLRARSSALSVQGVRRVINLRSRSSALSVQGVRRGINLRARSSALSVQGVRWCINLRALSSAL